jgi:formylglycine-generating enzyme
VSAFARRAAGAGVALGLAAACHTQPTSGGVILDLNIDRTLKVSDLSELRAEVDSTSDGGKPYYEQTFAIPKQLATFPATIAIRSNGDPGATVAVHLSLWHQGAVLDERDYQLADIPVDSVTHFDVTFSRQCTPGLPRCGSAQTCCPTAAGPAGCASQVINADQPEAVCRASDAGSPEAMRDGETDSLLDGSPGEEQDGTLEDGDASPVDAGADAAPPAPPVGYDGGVCPNTSCVEGVSHCVNGACVPVPASCSGGGPGAGFNCGGFDGTRDCCAVLDVPLTPKDSFFRLDDFVDKTESYPATVSQFGLDVYEVTVGRFRKFVSAVVGDDSGVPWVPAEGSGTHTHLGPQGLNAGGTSTGVPEPGWSASWDSQLPATKAAWDAELTCRAGDTGPYFATWTPAAGTDGEERPINCISWYAAYAFCIWDGGFLPSTTEWNFAAAGGQSQFAFAWGNTAPANNSNRAIYGCIYGSSGTNPGACLGPLNLAPVGQAPAGQALWGQMDMTGNVNEWTLDFWSEPYPNPCDDCADLTTGGLRIFRGGGFSGTTDSLYTDDVWVTLPEVTQDDIGIRCARPPY